MKKPFPIGYIIMACYLGGWAVIMLAVLVIAGP